MFKATRLRFARCPPAERFPMIRFGNAPTSTVTIDDQRIVPNAHTRDVIYGGVLNELSRVRPNSNQTLLTPDSVLTEAGIDDARLEDAIVRLQGSYGMRLHEEWIQDIQTCDDLVTCIATRMFDTKDTEALDGDTTWMNQMFDIKYDFLLFCALPIRNNVYHLI